MKKRLTIFIFAAAVVTLMLSGCRLDYNSSEIEIEYKEGVYHSKKWDPSDFEEPDNTISNSNTDKSAAISIACAEFEKVQQKGVGKDYVLTGVFYDTEDEVWVVYFCPKPIVPGSCYNIAVSKKTGKILNMWPGE